MWLYFQTWLPLLSVSLTAAICFSVAAFVMVSAQTSNEEGFSRYSSGVKRRATRWRKQ